jgi:hypothetical protein
MERLEEEEELRRISSSDEDVCRRSNHCAKRQGFNVVVNRRKNLSLAYNYLLKSDEPGCVA